MYKSQPINLPGDRQHLDNNEQKTYYTSHTKYWGKSNVLEKPKFNTLNYFKSYISGQTPLCGQKTNVFDLNQTIGTNSASNVINNDTLNGSNKNRISQTKMLSNSDIHILTGLAIEDYSHRELAKDKLKFDTVQHKNIIQQLNMLFVVRKLCQDEDIISALNPELNRFGIDLYNPVNDTKTQIRTETQIHTKSQSVLGEKRQNDNIKSDYPNNQKRSKTLAYNSPLHNVNREISDGPLAQNISTQKNPYKCFKPKYGPPTHQWNRIRTNPSQIGNIPQIPDVEKQCLDAFLDDECSNDDDIDMQYGNKPKVLALNSMNDTFYNHPHFNTES